MFKFMESKEAKYAMVATVGAAVGVGAKLLYDHFNGDTAECCCDDCGECPDKCVGSDEHLESTGDSREHFDLEGLIRDFVEPSQNQNTQVIPIEHS